MERLQQVTLRLPPELVEDLKREAERRDRSLNGLAQSVLADWAERARALRAAAEIARLARDIRRRGLQEDSVPLIRSLREGEGRR